MIWSDLLLFIETPNLPKNNVTAMLLSPQYEEVVSDLMALNIELVLTEPCTDVQPPVSLHADILCHHLGNEEILIYPYSYCVEESLLAIGMKPKRISTPLQPAYPHDVLLNAARVGNRLICNKKYTDSAILSAVTYEEIFDVSQGYAKCSVLVVDEKSIITADKAIATAWNNAGLCALLISEGGIRLDGYDYGFIGGTGVKLSDKKIYFTGRLSMHRDCTRIRRFLEKRSIEIIEGSYKSLVDIGSMIPLLQSSD